MRLEGLSIGEVFGEEDIQSPQQFQKQLQEDNQKFEKFLKFAGLEGVLSGTYDSFYESVQDKQFRVDESHCPEVCARVRAPIQQAPPDRVRRIFPADASRESRH